jgi:hypothetical protein
MKWKTFYKLLRKYDGDLNRASPHELRCADIASSGNPFTALRLAREKYEAGKEREEWEARLYAEKAARDQLQVFEMTRGCGQ